MSYPPGVTQWHIDYYAGGYLYDEPREDDELEPDYDAELDWESLLDTYR